MKVVRTIQAFPESLGNNVGFVPTMGAFHEGHLTLMRRAKAECDVCVVSLFVNPTQFGKNEDFDRYPRDEERDFELAKSMGVDLMFAPTREEMYSGNHSTIHIAGIGDQWEGAVRPGHFDGVATVVAKLFNIVRPDAAYFGLKDLQQCAVVKAMVRDLNFHPELRFHETVREADGLAMSSRNVYLAAEERKLAPELHRSLQNCAKQISQAEVQDLPELMNSYSKTLNGDGFAVNYFALVDRDSFEETRDPNEQSALIVAAKLGAVRLIDNVLLGEPIRDNDI